MGEGNLSGQMDCLQVSKDLITIFDWEPAGGQVASFQRAACACSTERHIWSQCKLLLFFPVPSTKVGVRAISSVQLLSHVPLLATPWTAAHQAPCPSPLPEFTQIHVHWVGDVIQPCHPLSSPFPGFNLSQHQGLLKWVSSSHQVAEVLEFQLQHESFQWIVRTDFL